jgi:hypothetical protein
LFLLDLIVRGISKIANELSEAASAGH